MVMKDRVGVPIYLFAKAPVPGKVKTRMESHVSMEKCAYLAELMLEQSIEKIHQYWPGPLFLTVYPDKQHAVFDRLLRQYDFEMEIQIAGNLGDKLYHFLDQGISRHGYAAVMGCDVPQVSGEILGDLYYKVVCGENVIGPAIDGGFYFLGLNKLHKNIFNNIEWEEDRVLPQLEKNMKNLNIECSYGEILRDIDLWQDLVWLAQREKRYQVLFS